MTKRGDREPTQPITCTHTPAGQALSTLILEGFRLHGLLRTARDRLMHPLGFRVPRWEGLGALQLTGAHRAWQMGLTRQIVQRTVDLLAQEGGITLADTPHHQRATCVDCTPRGRRIMEAAHQL